MHRLVLDHFCLSVSPYVTARTRSELENKFNLVCQLWSVGSHLSATLIRMRPHRKDYRGTLTVPVVNIGDDKYSLHTRYSLSLKWLTSKFILHLQHSDPYNHDNNARSFTRSHHSLNLFLLLGITRSPEKKNDRKVQKENICGASSFSPKAHFWTLETTICIHWRRVWGETAEKYRTVVNYLGLFAILEFSKRTGVLRFPLQAPCTSNQKCGSLGYKNEITTACAQKWQKDRLWWFVSSGSGYLSSRSWGLLGIKDGCQEFRSLVFGDGDLWS